MSHFRSLDRFIIISLALLGLSVSSVNATTVSDRATGLTSPDPLSLDFGSNLYGDLFAITNQFSKSNNVTFEGDPRYRTTANDDLPAIAGGYLFGNIKNATGGIGGNPFDILFSIDVTNALFSFRTNPGTSTFTAYLDGELQETFNAATNGDAGDNTGRFYGFTDILFNKITISANTGIGTYNLDNLQFNAAPLSAVPVPAAVWLFGTALIGLVGFSKRRKAA